jgi:putative oxygen-independent coproporphyrinogen III oxidase
MAPASPPPLSLYIHLPWCVRKCPYCDFNSHATHGELPEDRYVDALLGDLATEATAVKNRTIETVFLGGGTPSLFSPEAIARLLAGTRARLAIAPEAEITLEANPGTVDVSRFRGFREAGVNRLSIGVQSFEPEKLKALGRIHGVDEALAAADAARVAGFANFNLDLMYGLPGQTVAQAVADLGTAIALRPVHLSVYQLTLEPNTLFHQHPPSLPDEDTIEEMRQALVHALEQNGYDQYEVSAYAQAGWQCRHNRNYWEFGDYLGIGAGAHGKISSAQEVTRTAKTRHPQAYLRDTDTGAARSVVRTLAVPDLVCEFMLNALRLRHGFPTSLFAERTGLALDAIAAPLQTAQERGLLELDSNVRTTALGRRFLNDLTMLFLP